MLNICPFSGLQSKSFGTNSKALRIPEAFATLPLQIVQKILVDCDNELTHREQHLLFTAALRSIPKVIFSFENYFPIQQQAFYDTYLVYTVGIADKLQKFPKHSNFPNFAITTTGLRNGAKDLVDYLTNLESGLPSITTKREAGESDDHEMQALLERIFRSNVIRARADWLRSKLKLFPETTVNSIVKTVETCTISPKADLVSTKDFLLSNIELCSQHDGSMLQATIRALDKLIINSLSLEKLVGIYSLSDSELESLERTTHLDLRSKVQALKDTISVAPTRMENAPNESDYTSPIRYKLACARWKAQNA